MQVASSMNIGNDGIRLNLGCGDRCAADEIGVDIRPTAATRVVANLDSDHLPFADSSVDSIRTNHCLEHLGDLIRVMEEIHRVLKPGGTIDIRVPHVSHFGYFRDPTHRRPFTYGTFDYFVRGEKPHAYTPVEFEYVSRELVFGRGLRERVGRFLYALSPRRYEKYYMWSYPCFELHVVLRALKSSKG